MAPALEKQRKLGAISIVNAARVLGWPVARGAKITYLLREFMAKAPRPLGQGMFRLLLHIFVRLRYRKAMKLWAQNDKQGALSLLAKALEKNPYDLALLTQIASYELMTRDAQSAEVRLRQVIERSGGVDRCSQWALNLFVLALLDQHKLEEAERFLADLPTSLQGIAEVQFLRAHILRYSRRYDAAEQTYRRLFASDPHHHRALRELAGLLGARGKLSEAVALHRQLIEVTGDPAESFRSHSHALLAQGRIREGWAHYRLRPECIALRGLADLRVWDGSDLTGRSIFVIAEGGTGDEFRDAACYGAVVQAAGVSTISCDPRLAGLLSRSFPQARFWPLRRHDRVSATDRWLSRLFDDEAFAEMKRHDYCILSPDLFCYLKPNLADYGTEPNYLKPDPVKQRVWRERLAALPPGPKIGISWRSLNLSYRRRGYYTELRDWGPILSTPGIVFINLQYGDCEADLLEAERAFGVRIWRWPDLDITNDIDDVAALMSLLDLVLAPNTSTLELAGALGTRAWYMINEPHTRDHFRMQRSSEHDLLYPSVRIVMADPIGDQASLIARVAADLFERFRYQHS